MQRILRVSAVKIHIHVKNRKKLYKNENVLE